MGNNNKIKFIALFNNHIANLNRVLKNIKSDVIAYYTCIDKNGIIIVTNKVTSLSDL